jgi:hypothetical protein
VRILTIVLCLVGLCALMLGVFSTRDATDSRTEPATRSVVEAPVANPTRDNDHGLSPAPERNPVALDSPAESIAVPAASQGDGGVQPEGPADAPDARPLLDPSVAQILGDQRSRIGVLEAEIERLKAELDECRNGPHSVLGALHALPEWPGMDKVQRAIVLDFLRRFPVTLNVGEATLIATHASPTGDTTREIISMLGRSRVLASMSPEAREALQRADPEEFADYFGR